MLLVRAILYILAVLLILAAGLGVQAGRPERPIHLALLGAACALLAFALPTITAA